MPLLKLRARAQEALRLLTSPINHPKPGSSLEDIITAATYDPTCNVPLTETAPRYSSDGNIRTTMHTINTTTCLRLTTTQPSVNGEASITTYAYDSRGHLTSITDPTELATTYT
jgi:YD repeat-containing protein